MYVCVHMYSMYSSEEMFACMTSVVVSITTTNTTTT